MVDTKPFRWLHHALFFAVFVAAVVALVGFLLEEPYRWALLPVLVLFAVWPYVRVVTLGPAALVCGVLVFYAKGFVNML